MRAPRNVSVFTWSGAIVSVSTPNYVKKYSGTCIWHERLQLYSLLKKSHRNSWGPHVLIVGERDSGKTALARILFSYAASDSTHAIHSYIDVNASTASPTPFPYEAVSISVGTAPISIDRGFSDHSSCVMYGAGNPDAYSAVTTRLSEIAAMKRSRDPHVRAGWTIVDTGPATWASRRTIRHLIKKFSIDHVVVMGHEKIRRLIDPICDITMYCIHKPAVLEDKCLDRLRDAAVHTYLYGPLNLLTPLLQKVKLDDVVVVRLGQLMWAAPHSVLPIGTSAVASKYKATEVKPSERLVSSVMAISNATELDDILWESIGGFAKVVALDTDGITVLCPFNLTSMRHTQFWIQPTSCHSTPV